MATETATATTWAIDPTHSEVQFKVKHLMVSTVTGLFSQYEGQLETHGDDFTDAKISFSADVASISTGNEQRDGHLKSADFFDVEKFPKLTFSSTSVTKTGDDTYNVVGDLTMHGVTKPVTLKVEYGGQMQDFYGQTKAGFELTGTLKRKEFGLVWDGVTEAGGVVVSDDVKLVMNIQVTKQA
ncbi:YceI family protein [Spirosoma sp. KNUC1025]|uniref:YceI family protein n=1 Tax=Spirosoma sp. KNUC1025 TaxID=2894082 RepID=UPI00386B51AB|nr:YceI family protein [Spirosoma sp. KNUC1025]